MRTKFKAQLAGLAEALSDGEIDVFLNGAYQFAIPDEVSGFITEGLWTITTVADTGTYSHPSTLYSVRMRRPKLDDTYYLGFYSRPELFWDTYDRVSTANARPTGALFYGQECELRPIPDAVYTVRVYARVYPAVLTANGLDNRTHALATVYAAAQEYAEEGDHEALMAKLVPRYERQKSALQARSNNVPRERYQVRSF